MVSGGNLRRRGVEPDHGNPEPGDRSGNLSFTTPDVQDPPGPTKAILHHGKDLSLIFGIGPFGEVLLPPLPVLFPQLFPVHTGQATAKVHGTIRSGVENRLRTE